ncbi:hypothetical protein [Calothrix sp. UHCC 0171]|uniref:hypothetical protein n=1 Tax=Calothrix sp. UHCC 0171 TaxID=3110245 RepID=UPI002B20A8D0|nr:hypothetical protein [Calothrix sp. UHCC 0171]MEA5573135.1 hypothetical protein [Calothrix sp. UHCC 0171]
MNSSSQSANSDTSGHRLADIAGTIIAMLTLTLPLLAIAQFSSVDVENSHPQTVTYKLPATQK